MADVSQTPANVVPSTNAEQEWCVAGETITAGMPVFLKAADSRVWKAQADAATDDDVYGIALNGASAGQPISVQKNGQINLGGTLVVGTVYVVSAAAGAICPWADLVTGNYVTLLGVAITAAILEMKRYTTSIQIPA